MHGVVVHLLHLELHLLGVALELPRLHLHLRNLHLGPVEAALRVQKIVRELRAVPLGALLQLAEILAQVLQLLMDIADLVLELATRGRVAALHARDEELRQRQRDDFDLALLEIEVLLAERG